MYLVLDLETGFKEVYKRKGNPFYNPIVAIGLYAEDWDKPEGIYIPQELDQEKLEITGIFEYDTLIGHNIKYDLLYLWKYDWFQDWLKDSKNKIYDTQYGEYMLSGHQVKFAALRDLAVNKYKCKVREKKMEEYWAKDIDTIDIPKELVIEDVKNDVEDTKAIYEAQRIQLEEQGMKPLFDVHMNLLLATCEMEYNGFKVDRAVLKMNKQLLEAKLQEELGALIKLVEKYWK